MNFKKLAKGIVVILITILFLENCTKIKTTDIGTDLLPVVDNITTFDTSLDVITTNFIFGDSAIPLTGRDVNGEAAEHVLGYVSNDPQFGKTIASIYAEFKPPYYKFSYENVKDSLYLDSIVLCLRNRSIWGDTNAIQKIDVYELDTKLRNDTAYGINTSVVYTVLAGTKTFAPSTLNDSIFPYQQRLKDQLRIRLNDELGVRFLSQDTAAGQPLNNDSLFREFFQGLAIVPDINGAGANANALMNFDMGDTSTHLRIYYRYTKNGQDDTTFRDFNFDNSASRSAHVNHIIRDYTGSQLEAHQPTNPAGDSIVFMQTTPGTYAIIRMPELNAFKALKGNVMVHLAELRMEQVPAPASELNNFFSAPALLYADFYDTTRKNQYPFLTDGFLNGTYTPQLIGGLRKLKSENGQEIAYYQFNLSRYVQGIITRNQPNFPISLTAPFLVRYSHLFLGFGVNPLAMGRVKLGGGSHSDPAKMKLRIIYSKI